MKLREFKRARESCKKFERVETYILRKSVDRESLGDFRERYS